MYMPDAFVETRSAEVARIVSTFPLAVVVTCGPDGPAANHIPLLMDSRDRLIGHVARANPMSREIADGARALAIFRADDAYVSPNWYPSKFDHHRHVPTWNYQVVHAHGAIRFRYERKAIMAAVGKLTRQMEDRVSGPNAWRMADAPADFLADMLSRIVAFRLTVTRIEAKSKLNQNRAAADVASVAAAVERRGNPALAAAMRRAPKR